MEQKNESLIKDAAQKILDEYSEDRINEMFDEELSNGDWLDDDWEDDYESEYDAYLSLGRGEIEDVINNEMYEWYTSKYGEFDNEDMWDDILELLIEEYPILKTY